MLIHVQYRNFLYDFVNARDLDNLIAAKSIRLFYRPAVKEWVNVDRGQIRGAGTAYAGPERRQAQVVAVRLHGSTALGGPR
jgi:hypothetical protein